MEGSLKCFTWQVKWQWYILYFMKMKNNHSFLLFSNFYVLISRLISLERENINFKINFFHFRLNSCLFPLVGICGVYLVILLSHQPIINK